MVWVVRGHIICSHLYSHRARARFTATWARFGTNLRLSGL